MIMTRQFGKSAILMIILLALTPGCIQKPDLTNTQNTPITDCDEQIDQDCDSIDNSIDNCIDDYNPDQLNFDNDTTGDECDTDIDNDGFINTNDFFDLGDGVLVFNWSLATIDSNYSYDEDSSGPDLVALLEVDWEGDGIFSNTYRSETIANITNSTNIYQQIINPSESRNEVKIKIRLFDVDNSTDELLDYVQGTSGKYYTFTIPLFQTYSDVELYDARGESMGIKVEFRWEITALS